MGTRGQVKWFDPKKGYGFIVGPTGQDVFVHYTQIQGDGFRSLKDGETVDYELIQGDKGWQARTVNRTGAPSEGEGETAPVAAIRPPRAGGYSRGNGHGNGNGGSPSLGYSNSHFSKPAADSFGT